MFTKRVYLLLMGLFIWMGVACVPTMTQEHVAQKSTIAATETAAFRNV